MIERVARLLMVAAGLIIILLLVRQIGVATILSMLRSTGWGFLWVAGLYAAHVLTRAAALWRALPEHKVRYSEVLNVRFSGEAVEFLTFTGPFLAEPTKAYLLNRRGVPLPEAFGAIAVEYLLYTLVSAWMAVAALSVLLARGVVPHGLIRPVEGVVAGMVLFTFGCIWAAASGIGLIAPILRVVGVRAAAARFEPVERVMVAFMHRRPGRLCEVLGIEAVGHALLAAEVWLVFGGLGLPLGAFDPFVFEGGVKVISVAFFFVPGQIGAQEGVYALLAGLLGFPRAAGLSFALVRRVRALLIGAAGLATLARAGVSDSGRHQRPA